MSGRKVRAFAVVGLDGVVQATGQTLEGALQEYGFGHPVQGAHVIRLVEHDPAADAVVRAAKALAQFTFDDLDLQGPRGRAFLLLLERCGAKS